MSGEHWLVLDSESGLVSVQWRREASPGSLFAPKPGEVGPVSYAEAVAYIAGVVGYGVQVEMRVMRGGALVRRYPVQLPRQWRAG